MKGYNLHKKRIDLFSGNIIRTIKYPLKPLTDNLNLSDIEQNIIKDDLRIRGDVNLNDFINFSFQNKNIYTLIDFWFDSLRAGVIWQPSKENLINLINKIYFQKSKAEIIFENSSLDIKKFFDKEKFINSFILKGEIRIGKNKNSFIKELTKVLKEEFKGNIKENKKDKFIINKDAQLIIDKIVNLFFKNDKLKIIGLKNQNKIWKNNFKIDKNLLKDDKLNFDYTFFIIPELVDLSQNNIDYLIVNRKKFLSDKKIDIDLKEIFGIGNNGNALSNYLNLIFDCFLNNNINLIYDDFNKLVHFNDQDKKIILNSLKYLSKKAQLLNHPNFLNLSWDDYRSVFSGKFESWLSNYIKRQDELDSQINDLNISLNEIKKYIQKFVNNNLNEFDDDFKLNSELVLNNLNDFQKIIDKRIINELFFTLYSELKKNLNFFYQKYIKEDLDIIEFEPFKNLFKKIYKPVNFYGKSKKENNLKFLNSFSIVKDGIKNVINILKFLKDNFEISKNYLESVDNDKENFEIIFRIFLSSLSKKIKNNILNSKTFIKKYYSIINFVLLNYTDLKQKDYWDRGNYYVFYKSEYSKGTNKQIDFKKDLNFKELLENYLKDLIYFSLGFNIEQLLINKKELLDWIELNKTVISLLIRFSKIQKFDLESLNFNIKNFKLIQKYLDYFGYDLDKNRLNYIIQSLFFSEFRGAATLFSKEKYLAKYNLQFIKSNEKLPLYYYSENISNFENPKNLVNKKHLYLLSLQKIKDDKKENVTFIQLLKNSKKKIRNKLENYQDKLLKLESSKYQMQFLDKFIYKGKKWQNVEISLSEWSLIVEKEFKIEWDIENGIPKFILIKDSKKNKLYFAIPFNIKSSFNEYEQKVKQNLIMGIDIGEYGIAYAVVDFKNEKDIKILNSGFIYSKNIAKIKDEFSKIQKKSKSGIFNQASSIVSEIRENAVGILRNKIHSIFINYHPQNLSYEYSIDNFETGSGRTVSIYKTIKKSDVPSIIEADKSIQKHVWGVNWKKDLSIGQNLSAYGSSYICSNCYQSLYQITENDLDKIYIKNRSGNILEIESPYGLIYGYSKQKEYDKNYKFKKSKNSLKKLQKILKDFSRPPLLGSETISKFTKFNKEDLEKFKKLRGNSSVFICPFCLHVSDADIQAALMMAIRGYLKNYYKNKEEKIDYFHQNIEFLKNLKYKLVIDLDLNKNIIK